MSLLYGGTSSIVGTQCWREEGDSELNFSLNHNIAPLYLELETMPGQGTEEGIWRKSAVQSSVEDCKG